MKKVSLEAELSRYIEAVRTDWSNVGVAVAVVQERDVIFAQGFGVKELGQPAPIDAHTVFQVGSTSKAFTTAALESRIVKPGTNGPA